MNISPGSPSMSGGGGGGGGAVEGAKVTSSWAVRSVKSRSLIWRGRARMRLAIWAVSMDRSKVSMALGGGGAAEGAPAALGFAAEVPLAPEVRPAVEERVSFFLFLSPFSDSGCAMLKSEDEVWVLPFV